MYSLSLTARPGETHRVTLPGVRELTLRSNGEVAAELLDGFDKRGMVTRLEDERLKRYALSGDVRDLGEGWQEGRKAFCSISAYLPSPGQGQDVNPYAAARQVVQIGYKSGDPLVSVTTNINQHDRQVYDHQMEGNLQESTGTFHDVKEATHFTIGDNQFLFVDGEKFGWGDIPADEHPKNQVADLPAAFHPEGGVGIQETHGFIFMPGATLRKRSAS